MRKAGLYSRISSSSSGRSGSQQHSLPLARIKKIMKKSGDGVKMISGEAPIVFSRAVELFVEELTRKSWVLAAEAKRRTLQRDDVVSAIQGTDVFDFLVDLVCVSDQQNKRRESPVESETETRNRRKLNLWHPPTPPPPRPTRPPPPPPVERTSRAEQEEKEAPEKYVSSAAAEKYSPAVPQKVADPVEKYLGGSFDRDAVLARVETEKRLALIKAWEESEKTKVENKTYKKLSGIGSWENTKRAAVEAELKKIEEKLEKKKAEYAEMMKNKIVEIHKAAEEKRAMVEAKKGESFLKIEETAAKFRATGYTPRKLLGCCTG
ncbi:hypothetical protein NL676_010189 [Syzygium grande]|nr:hypothetical protein NL676_010189 [Syzygium grande]